MTTADGAMNLKIEVKLLDFPEVREAIEEARARLDDMRIVLLELRAEHTECRAEACERCQMIDEVLR